MRSTVSSNVSKLSVNDASGCFDVPIALTSARDGVARSLGAETFLAKPVDLATLADAVARVLADKTESA